MNVDPVEDIALFMLVAGAIIAVGSLAMYVWG